MKVKVNKDACIGCGACAAICDEVFEINDEGLSEAKVEEVKEEFQDEVRDAADSCPTGAIEIEEGQEEKAA
ncbi:MAG TPA: ferredoxin [Candidatus Onthousia faecipullorum]|uniref:Ferredoxin n=1 Tax=Candidatus Onthousia faecipullorum TaxID=2840887 RepID=A0A9D1GBV8_9FIRM|nr:ferredoxin [Candidatus Onthousia faecipullorum]